MTSTLSLASQQTPATCKYGFFARRAAALLIGLVYSLSAASQAGPSPAQSINCSEPAIRCAKTVSAAVGSEGRIWFAWSVERHLYVNYSDDRGASLSAPVRVNALAEDIAARGENRPKIGLDRRGNVYLSWVKKLHEKWTSDIRFAWSSDGGKSYSSPVRINDDEFAASHSFNEMLVSADGSVHIGWLDGRHARQARRQGQAYKGSALYLASFRPEQSDLPPTNRLLAHDSCVCCRIAMAFDQRENPVLLWRHIFGDNIRDHALLSIDHAGNPPALRRVSFENWQIDGCPHHGPSLLSKGKRLHMSWFNDAPQASGLFYAYSDDAGAVLSPVQHFADRGSQPAHPQLALSRDGSIQLAWLEHGPSGTAVKLIQSDRGDSWSEPVIIAAHDGAADYPVLLSHRNGNLLLWHRPGQPLQLTAIP